MGEQKLILIVDDDMELSDGIHHRHHRRSSRPKLTLL